MCLGFYILLCNHSYLHYVNRSEIKHAYVNFTIISLNVPLSDYYTDKSDGDFTEVSPAKTVKIAKDQDSVQITIDTTEDDICEGTESFKVYLSNIDGGIQGNAQDFECFATVSITDNEGKALVNDIFSKISLVLSYSRISKSSMVNVKSVTLHSTNFPALKKPFGQVVKVQYLGALPKMYLGYNMRFSSLIRDYLQDVRKV